MSASTPRALGYRMPAEWEPHEATWLSWPRARRHQLSGRATSAVPALWRAMVEALSAGELVHVNVSDEAQRGARCVRCSTRRAACARDRVFLHRIADRRAVVSRPRTDVRRARRADARSLRSSTGATTPGAASTRRTTATTRCRREIAALLGVRAFHAGDRPRRRLDRRQRPRHAAHHRVVPAEPEPQPHARTRRRSSAYLRDYLACAHVVWLGDGIVGDDTDGHVDDLTRFVDARTVVTVVEDDPADENYRPLRENLRRLRAARDQDGRPLAVLELPMPAPVDARRAAPAGELRQLLRRQRRRAGADLRRSERRRRARDCSRAAFPAGASSASRARISSGASARSIASPSSSPRSRRGSSARRSRRRAGLSSAVGSAFPAHSPHTRGGHDEALLQPADTRRPAALAARGDRRALRARASRLRQRRAQEARVFEDPPARRGARADRRRSDAHRVGGDLRVPRRQVPREAARAARSARRRAASTTSGCCTRWRRSSRRSSQVFLHTVVLPEAERSAAAVEEGKTQFDEVARVLETGARRPHVHPRRAVLRRRRHDRLDASRGGRSWAS